MLHSIGTFLAKILVTPIVFLMGVAGYPQVIETPTQLGATLPIAGQTYTLAGSGVSAAATSITLSSLTLPQTGYAILDADLSDTFYITLEPGNRTKQEIVSCTTVTQNANNTATLSGCVRGLMPISPYTATSTYAFPHGGGTSVVFSNPPQLYNQFTAKANDEVITGTWTFSNAPITASTTYASETITGSVRLATSTQIASSTEGTSTARLVIPAKLSTSTAPASGHVVPVTGSDGNLAEGFLPTTLSDTYSIPNAFGSGVDGDVTISSPTTLTRDMFYDDLVVNSTLYTNGWRIFAKSSISGSGSIVATGTPGTNGSTGGAGGAGGAAVSGFTKNSAGGIGGSGTQNQDCVQGTPGGNTSSGVSLLSYTSNTGATVGGDDGGCGPISPGVGGTVTVVATSTMYGETFNDAITFSHISYSTSTRLWSSAGGSGGGGGSSRCLSACNGTTVDTGSGGGGGASGQILLLVSKLISGTFSINASGGNGGNGGDGTSDGDTSATGGGGGGGGNGGTIVLIYGTKTHTGTVTANGGTGGAGGANAGVAGANGGTGLIYDFPVISLLR